MFNIPLLDRILNTILNGKRNHLLSDKLNSIITPAILLIFAIIISSKQHIGNPINCIVSSEFRSGWENYVENYCFLSKVYHVSPEENLPFDKNLRDARSFNFYSWIPIMLTVQSLIFCVPLMLWDHYTKNSLINYRKFLHNEKRSDILTFCLKNSAKNYKNFSIANSHYTILFLFKKLFDIVIIYVQFEFLSLFFGFNFIIYGYEALRQNSHEYFPYVNFCDVSRRTLGNPINDSIQCFFSVNLFNKIAFISIWLWLIILLIYNLISFLYWIIILFFRNRDLFYKKYLPNSRSVDLSKLSADMHLVILFIDSFEHPHYVSEFIDCLHNICTEMDFFEKIV